MTVTSITEATKAKYNIYIDEEFAFVLYKGELKTYGIKVGKVIDDDTYDLIQTEVLYKRARLRAMHLLEKRPYTEKGIRQKLSENKYSDELIDATIDYLKGYGYVDDLSYAKQYYYTYSGQKTIKRIQMDLMSKGVARNVIEQAYCESLEDGDIEDERQLLKTTIEKRHIDWENADQKEVRKLVNYLISKGFRPEMIFEEIKGDYEA